MNALERFLNENAPVLDHKKIISSEVEEFDSIVPPPSVFKYLDANAKTFFERPSLRFPPRTALKDPFELSIRWREIASPDTRNVFANSIKATMTQLTANKGLVLEILKQKMAETGTFLGPEEMAEAARRLLTPEGRQFYDSVIEQALAQVDDQVETAFAFMDAGAAEQFESITSSFGILCLSDDPVRSAMWDLYASGGHGFVVEYNSADSFFKAANGRNLLWKVTYDDERGPDFFHNPLSIFLQKHRDYSFEREWRFLKELSQCNEETYENGRIYSCPVRTGMIKSVIFGYNYADDEIARDGARLCACFDPNIHIQVAVANRASGTIDLHQLA